MAFLLVAAGSCWGEVVKSSYSVVSSEAVSSVDSDFIHALTGSADLTIATLKSGSLFKEQAYNGNYDDIAEPLAMPLVILLLGWLTSGMLPTPLRERPKLSFVCSLVLERLG